MSNFYSPTQMDNISEKSSDEVQDPILYLDKCIDMASVIYDAIDIDKLEQNKKQNIEYLIALYHSTQGGLSDEERQLTLLTLNSKKEVLEQYGDEFYADLQNINQVALEFILDLCVEDMHYNSIEVLDLLYSAIRIRLSYVRTMLDAHELLTKTPNNDRNQDDIDLAENPEQNLSKSVETYKDKIEHIIQKWINLVMDLKSKSKRTIDMCCKIKDSKDYNVIAFDTSKVTDNSIDLHYEYSMSFVEFLATQCFFNDNVESIIPYILNDNYYKNVLIDSIQFSNLESLAFEKTLQKYFSVLENCPEKSKYKGKLLTWYQDTKDQYESLQPAIEMCCNLIKIYVENLEGMNENEKARFMEDMENTIVSMQNAQSRILKLMQHDPDIVPPKE